MSHPQPGHDYTEKSGDESKKEHLARIKGAMKKKLSYVSSKGVQKMISKGKRPEKEEDVSDHFREHRF